MNEELINFLRTAPDARLTNEGKWLVADDLSGGWVVREHIPDKHSLAILYQGDDLNEALKYLKGDF
jgi:hypothetical protein